MACNQKTLLLISSYADGEATREETARAIAHLETCQDCRKMVTDWQEQRQVLDWAYTLELPEQVILNVEKPPMINTARMPRGINWRWNWVKSAALAALVMVVFVFPRISNTNPMLGDNLKTGSKAQSARMPGNIQLKVSRKSNIVRINDHKIRLEQGQVSASVMHGTAFEVLTKRIRVIDIGTKFRVGIAPLADAVTVDEGCVDVYKGAKAHRVNKDQVLLAADGEEPNVVPFPVPTYSMALQDSDMQRSLISKIDNSLPQSGRNLDWNTGLNDLAVRFPKAQTTGGWCTTSGVSYSFASRILSNMRTRYFEIALALAGGATSSDWEVPVGFLQVDGIVTPVDLPADTYYVRLISQGGKLLWRLSGAKGGDTDIQLSMIKKSTSFPLPSQSFNMYGEYLAGNGSDLTWFMLKGPGKSQLAFRFEPRHLSLIEKYPDKYRAFQDISQQTAGVKGLNIASTIKQLRGEMLYLDLQRKRWVLVAWNDDIDKPFNRVSEAHQQGSTGTAVMGAISINTPMQEPNLPSGVYLLCWVWPGNSKVGHWVIATPDMQKQTVLLDKKTEACSNISEGGRYASVGINYRTSTDKSAFELQFQIYNPERPEVIFGQGGITIAKP